MSEIAPRPRRLTADLKAQVGARGFKYNLSEARDRSNAEGIVRDLAARCGWNNAREN